MDKPILNIKNLSVAYGNDTIIKNFSLEVTKGDVVFIGGKNGAGKSTLLKAIAGIIPTKSGEVILEGENILKLNTKKRIQLGIGYMMQHDGIFKRLTVEDHIILAAQQNKKQTITETWAMIHQDFPELTAQKKQVAGKLSGGQARFLSLAMLVAQGADNLWFLDEPSAGIAKELLSKIGNFLEIYLKKNDITCLLVEQNVEFGNYLSTSHTIF